MWLKKAQLRRFQEQVCAGFAEAAPGLSLARKTPQERLELARGFLHGYTRGRRDAGVESAGKLPAQEESLVRSMVEYAMYAHLFAYQMSGLMSPREFIRP